MPGRTITWSPALTAFVAALLMVHSGVSEVPGPVSLHKGEVLSTHHTLAANALGGERRGCLHRGCAEDEDEGAEEADHAMARR